MTHQVRLWRISRWHQNKSSDLARPGQARSIRNTTQLTTGLWCHKFQFDSEQLTTWCITLYIIHATSPTSSFFLYTHSPPSADVICGWSPSQPSLILFNPAPSTPDFELVAADLSLELVVALACALVFSRRRAWAYTPLINACQNLIKWGSDSNYIWLYKLNADVFLTIR